MKESYILLSVGLFLCRKEVTVLESGDQLLPPAEKNSQNAAAGSVLGQARLLENLGLMR